MTLTKTNDLTNIRECLFSQKEALKLTDYSLRQLKYFLYQLYLFEPIVIEHNMYFTFQQLIALKILQFLKEKGYFYSKIKYFNEFFKLLENDKKYKNKKYLLVAYNEIHLVCEDKLGKCLIDLVGEYQGLTTNIYILNLNNLIQDLDKSAKEIKIVNYEAKKEFSLTH
ncbi:MAG: hypothetical protein HC930_08230 [Hydrococcus sp. SU_1_0]|nr:hypothetical protein [Hydrococcus sp. SU_1_0]